MRGIWVLAVLLAPQIASAQAPTTLEISASVEDRARLQGQLVDLDVEVLPIDRPDASEVELSVGEAALCVFVRVGDGLRVGLIDRRASRWLVEETALAEGDPSVAIETAALTVRQWVRELLRGGALGVVRPATVPSISAPLAAPPAPAAQPTTARATVMLEAGWRGAIDGSDEPSHGPVMTFAAGEALYLVGLRVGVGLPQRWDLGEATIQRTQVELAAIVVLQAALDVWRLAGRVGAGVTLVERQTVAVGAGLRETAGTLLAVPVASAHVGVGALVVDGFEIRLWIGADAWLPPPVHRILGGEGRSSWPVQPSLELSLRVSP